MATLFAGSLIARLESGQLGLLAQHERKLFGEKFCRFEIIQKAIERYLEAVGAVNPVPSVEELKKASFTANILDNGRFGLTIHADREISAIDFDDTDFFEDEHPLWWLFQFTYVFGNLRPILYRGVEYTYSVAETLLPRVDVGNVEGLIQFVPKIIPAFVDNPEYGTEDAQTVAYRFTEIADQRTTMAQHVLPTIVSNIIIPAQLEQTNGFNEVYPVIIHGNFIELNGTIDYPHQIIAPVNASEGSWQAEQGASFTDSINCTDASNAYWQDLVTGAPLED